jgi:hypothetical protein
MGKGTKLFYKRFSSVRIHHHFGFLMGWAGQGYFAGRFGAAILKKIFSSCQFMRKLA